ncbi:MAG: stage V sporulation protein AB [Bacillota bacterium]
MTKFLVVLLGFAEGVIIGAALLAFLLFLDIIPRLIRFGSSREYIKSYQLLVVLGAFSASHIQFYDWSLAQIYFLNRLVVIIVGFVFGIFVGLIAAALTETLKVLPILSRRLGFDQQIKILLLAIISGKVVGSLIYWLSPNLWF